MNGNKKTERVYKDARDVVHIAGFRHPLDVDNFRKIFLELTARGEEKVKINLTDRKSIFLIQQFRSRAQCFTPRAPVADTPAA